MNKRTKLLIGYDGSESADAAVEDIQRAGLPRDTEAIVFAVADVWFYPPPADPTLAAPSSSLDHQILRGQCLIQRGRRGRLLGGGGPQCSGPLTHGLSHAQAAPRDACDHFAR